MTRTARSWRGSIRRAPRSSTARPKAAFRSRSAAEVARPASSEPCIFATASNRARHGGAALCRHLVEAGTLRRDPAQERIVARARPAVARRSRARSLARKSSALGWLFARKPAAATAPKGLYIHGGVGRGKTMLMDLFFETGADARASGASHFNDFMADVHDRIQKHRQARKDGTDQRGRSDPAGGAADRRGGPASVLRRVLGHRHRRRDDPVAAVLGAFRRGRGAGGDVERRARRPLPRRPQPRPVPALRRRC